MRTDPEGAGDNCDTESKDEMTLDGVISVALMAVVAAVIIYLFVALLDPERF